MWPLPTEFGEYDPLDEVKMTKAPPSPDLFGKHGLTSAQAADQMAEWGKNEIPEEKEPLWRMFAMQFVGTMPAMIEIAMILSAILGSWIDFWIIFVLLMTNATLGFIEEMNAQASISALKDGLVRKLPVKRDGVFSPLEINEIVPGDLVFLRGGNVVPADCIWQEGDELQVDQAALTGESLPVQVPREDSEGEPGSGKKLWSGSIVKIGEAECFVTETGLHTMIGEAAKSIQESGGKHVGVFEAKISASAAHVRSPPCLVASRFLLACPLKDAGLSLALAVMSGRVLIVLTLLAVGSLLMYQVGYRDVPLAEVLEMSLSLVIASVPIALPMVMKVTLAVGAKEMAKEGGIVTHLTALEEIASMVVLCSDKTGTLTTASMTVYPDEAAVFVTAPATNRGAKAAEAYTGADALKLAALASNPANKDDAIDRAVYQAYAKLVGKDVDTAARDLGAQYVTEKYYGFNPVVKRTVADVVDQKTNKKLRVVKGIVSLILKTNPNDGGQQWEVDKYQSVSSEVLQADAAFGKKGYKTIGVGVSENGGPMRYIATLPIMDPPRVDTAQTIADIKGAYVDVKMITGDHLNIARELARQIKLGGNIFPNTDLWPASYDRDDLIAEADGFAQVMPRDKHEVVRVLQSQGKVVGMTGDGVNDAPALAKAQIGIAVAGATDAAQAAADIILTEEGLSPIFTAILESRRIFKRLKAYVIYRICVTVQVVCFLCIVSFVYNEAFDALYIILLALFHDLTIVTIAYDLQTPSAKPEHPTVLMLIAVAYSMGFVLAASSTVLYAWGHHILSSSFADPEYFAYKESCMFLQISHSSAILIFAARTQGFFFMSRPAIQLFLSAVVSQVVVNAFLLFSGGFIVEQLAPSDVGVIWVYDFVWLIILDLVKMGINYIQDGPIEPFELTTGRNLVSKSVANDTYKRFANIVRNVSRMAMGINAVKSREKGRRPTLSKGLRINPHTGMPIPAGGRPLSGPGWH